MSEKKKIGIEAIDGIISGMGDILGKLGELAEKGEQLKGSNEFTIKSKGKEGKEGKEAKGIYGFSVNVGLGEEGEREVKVEPFGNMRRDEESGESVIEEVREPMVDVFEEGDHLLLVAEMPGIGKKDLNIGIIDDILTLAAEHGDIKYRKEVLLPGKFCKKGMQLSVTNGVVEIKLRKQSDE